MLQHRLLYRVVDEDGLSTVGTTVGDEDVREFVEKLNKRFRDAQSIHVELVDTFEIPDPLTEEDLNELQEDID